MSTIPPETNGQREKQRQRTVGALVNENEAVREATALTARCNAEWASAKADLAKLSADAETLREEWYRQRALCDLGEASERDVEATLKRCKKADEAVTEAGHTERRIRERRRILGEREAEIREAAKGEILGDIEETYRRALTAVCRQFREASRAAHELRKAASTAAMIGHRLPDGPPHFWKIVLNGPAGPTYKTSLELWADHMMLTELVEG